MGTITINGRKVEFTNEKNILTIIRRIGIDLPTLCYQPELTTFSDCRLCTVEDDRAGPSPPAPSRPGTAWSSIPTPSGCASTAS